MTYNPAIPQPNDLISASQAQIQTNFSQADTIFDENHFTFDNSTTANRGKHRRSTYVEVTDPATLANEIALYSKDLAGATTLYLRQESNGSIVQMSGTTPVSNTNGSTFLPGGLLMNWGFGTIAGGSTFQAITFATSFSGAPYSIVITPNSNTALASQVWGWTAPAAGGFTVNRASTTNSTDFYYIAIGPK